MAERAHGSLCRPGRGERNWVSLGDNSGRSCVTSAATAPGRPLPPTTPWPRTLPGSPHHVSGQRAPDSGFRRGSGSATFTTPFSCRTSPTCEKGSAIANLWPAPWDLLVCSLITHIINPLYLTPSCVNTQSGLVFLSKSRVTQWDRISTSTLLVKGRLNGRQWKAKCLRYLRGGVGISGCGEKLLEKASGQSWSLNRTWEDGEHTDSGTVGRDREKHNAMLRDKIRKVCKQTNRIILWGERQDSYTLVRVKESCNGTLLRRI